MKNIGTRTIETERLILRKMKLEDGNLIYKNWTSDPLVSKYVNWNKHSSINDTKDYVNYKINRYLSSNCYDWVVILKDINEPIGEIDAVKVSIEDNSVEIGYNYGSKFWNKGYATEALKAIIRYMFIDVEVDKITACHIDKNPASGKVMVKAGMKFDYIVKDFFNNEKHKGDLLFYSINKEEYHKNK